MTPRDPANAAKTRRLVALDLPDGAAVDALLEAAEREALHVELLEDPAALRDASLETAAIVVIGLTPAADNGASDELLRALRIQLPERTALGLVVSDSNDANAAYDRAVGASAYADHVLFTSSGTQQSRLFLDQLIQCSRQNIVRANRSRVDRFRARVLSCVPDLVLVIDRFGTYHDATANATSRHLFARRPEDIVGASIDEFFPPYYAEKILQTTAEVLSTGENRKLRYPVRIDGEERWFSGHCAPLHGSEPECVVWLARDITDNHDFARSPSDNRLLLEPAFDALPMAIFWKDIDGRFLGMNRSFLDALGVSRPEAVIGKTDYDFDATRAFAERYREDDRTVIETDTPMLSIIEKIGAGTANERWLRTNKVPLRNIHGDIVGVLGTFENVSEEQRLLEENRQITQLLRRAERLARMGSWQYDLGTHTLHWSDELYQLYERQPSQGPAAIEEMHEYYPDVADVERLSAMVRECIFEGTAGRLDLWLHAPSGERRRMRHVVERVSEQLTIGFMQDVTEATEQALAHRLATTLLESTQEVTSTGSWELDVRDMTLRWSDEMYDILDIDRVESVDFDLATSAWSEAETARMHHLLERCMRDGVPYDEVTEFCRRDGSQRYAQATARAIRDEGGTIIRVLGTLRDITDQQEFSEQKQRQETLLRQTTSLTGVGGWYYHRESDRFEPSPRAAVIFGVPEDFVVGFDDAMGLIVPRGRDEGRQILTRCLEDGESFTEDVRIETPDRRPVWCRISGEAHEKDGQILGIYGAVQDITAERRQLEQLEWANRLLAQTVSVSGIGGWHYSVADDRMDFTPMFRELLALGDEDPTTFEGALAFFHEADRAHAREQFQKSLKKGERLDMTVRMLDAKGRTLWARITAEPKLRNGKAVALYGAFQDVTEERERQERRRVFDARIQHAQKLESLGVLAGGIAHDFNNMLVSIIGYASMAMGATRPGSEAQSMVANISNAAQQAANLTKQLLAYSGKGQFVIEQVDISALVSEMSSILRIGLPKGVILKETYADNLPPVSGDRAQLAQVIMNLITNAGEAIGKRSGIVSLSTSLIDADAEYLADSEWDNQLEPGYYVCIEISDTGQGMTSEQRQKIFEPFYTTKFTGRGLGLAAVLGIIRGHHGAIRVYSEPGKGTSFKILLPITDEPEPVQTVAPPAPNTLSGDVLVVDDEASIRNVARLILERAGMSVVTANDGADAIERVRREPERFQVALIDMTMPHIDGRETFRQIHQLNPRIHVVLSSGYAEQDATSGLAGRRVAGFIQKPYGPQDLLATIRAAIEYDS